MAFWKQLAICLLLVAVAAVSWFFLYPGAPRALAGWGIDLPFVASAEPDAGDPASDGSDTMAANPVSPGGVITAPLRNATINDRLTAIGTGRALRTVSVTPFSSGRITEVRVESGAHVDAGDVIATLDSDSESIAVDRAKLSLEDEKAALERIKTLRTTNTATSVQVTQAELDVRNAELALRDAQLALDRRSIRAPIDGVVGILPVNEGQYITSDSNVVTIDDRSELLVDFWVPERFAGQIEVGQPVKATSVARADEVFEGEVNAVDNRVDPESRTLQVQARITNPADRLRAGMAFQVEMRFSGNTFPAVDPLAIQWSTEGAFVWAVQDGKARRTPVRIVQRNSDSVLVDGVFDDRDTVVVQGVHNVRDGEDVMIAERDGPDLGSNGSGLRRSGTERRGS